MLPTFSEAKHSGLQLKWFRPEIETLGIFNQL